MVLPRYVTLFMPNGFIAGAYDRIYSAEIEHKHLHGNVNQRLILRLKKKKKEFLLLLKVRNDYSETSVLL